MSILVGIGSESGEVTWKLSYAGEPRGRCAGTPIDCGLYVQLTEGVLCRASETRSQVLEHPDLTPSDDIVCEVSCLCGDERDLSQTTDTARNHIHGTRWDSSRIVIEVLLRRRGTRRGDTRPHPTSVTALTVLHSVTPGLGPPQTRLAVPVTSPPSPCASLKILALSPPQPLPRANPVHRGGIARTCVAVVGYKWGFKKSVARVSSSNPV